MDDSLSTSTPDLQLRGESADDPTISLRVAYIVLRFPRLSETFVAREIAALLDMGWDVTIYPLWRDRTTTVHMLVKPLLSAVRWPGPLVTALLAANLGMLRRQPKRYLSTLGFVASDIARAPKRGLKSLAMYPLMVWMASAMQRDEVEHIHAHFASYPALAGMVIKRLTGISYSFTAHAYDLYVRPLALAEKVESASVVITISEYNRRLIASLVDTGTPIKVVHCGVEIPPMLPDSVSGSQHIVCVARLEDKKGQTFLVEACGMLRDRGVPVTCTIAGGGPNMAMLQRQIDEANLGDVVHLTGPVTAEQVQEELRQATVFALPSIVTQTGNAEGIPVALMEAMAAGVPVVSTRITGIPELIDDGVSGFLVPAGDAPALADALQRLLENEALRNTFRQAGYERVAKDFRLESCVLEVADAIAEAVSS